MSGWNSTWRNLADQHPNICHAVEKVAVPSRVRPVNPVGENGDGIAAGCESSLMCNSFDPVATPGNDNSVVSSDGGSELAGYMIPVRGRRPRSGDRHEVAQRTRQEGGRAANPQHVRCSFPQVVEGTGPMSVAGDQRSDS
jgi:hypothetical protein